MMASVADSMKEQEMKNASMILSKELDDIDAYVDIKNSTLAERSVRFRFFQIYVVL